LSGLKVASREFESYFTVSIRSIPTYWQFKLQNNLSVTNTPVRLRLLPAFTGFFVAILLISNVASSKLVVFGRFTFDGGTLLFPLSYIFSDLLTEVYGFRIARRTIWIGFASQLAAVLLFGIVGHLPAPTDWDGSAAYQRILSSTTRIIIGSCLAYFAGSWVNDMLMSVLKKFTRGRFLWTRTIGSTLIGEGLDTALFCIVAFAGAINNDLLLKIILSNYIFKCGVEAAFTPATYWICRTVKRLEGMDTYDYGVNYTPFSWRIDPPPPIKQT
jgi:hypothetical protein